MERFLSISVYTRALGGVLLGPLVHSITLWIEVFVVNSENDIGGKPTTKKVILEYFIDCNFDLFSISEPFQSTQKCFVVLS